MYLKTGKSMREKTTEVKIHFRKFHEAQSNCLVFRIHPNEGVDIDLFTKTPGYDREFEAQNLTFSYPTDVVLPDAYEQVLVDAIHSRKSLFTSGSEVIRSWELLESVQSSWQNNLQPLHYYNIGDDISTIVA